MYNEYFGFRESPFSIAPDPRYLYMTDQHRDALAHLVYGFNSDGGCILLTGEVGTGKTTICRCLLEQTPEQANVALVMNPKVNEIELLETICDELGIDYPDAENTVKTYTDRIYQFLIESNRKNEKTVLIIDEAQNLSSSVLEQLRLLTNLETDQHKLLQIIILGQPELLDILSRNEMRQLAQRITARFHLNPLSHQELKAYINHRLAVAGQNVQVFPESSIKLIYRTSNGIPRLINIICDRSLLGAYVENRYTVDSSIIKKASKEVFGELKKHSTSNTRPWLYPAAAAVLVALVVTLYLFIPRYAEQPAPKSDTPNPVADTTSIDTDTHDSKTDTVDNDKQAMTIPSATLVQNQTLDQQDNLATSKQKDDTVTTDDIDQLLNHSDQNSLANAYSALFSLWGQQFDPESNLDACQQAQKLSLNCLQKTGNMNSLLTHNRPAILTLNRQDGSNRYLVITGIKNDIAHVIYDGSEYMFKINDIDRHWYGKFLLLWHQPGDYKYAITPGDNGPIVDWLSSNISRATNQTIEQSSQHYGESLENAVKIFQTNHGLIADGIVGPLTIIYLNTANGLTVPTLTQRS